MEILLISSILKYWGNKTNPLEKTGEFNIHEIYPSKTQSKEIEMLLYFVLG